jgi:hypothetical protein
MQIALPSFVAFSFVGVLSSMGCGAQVAQEPATVVQALEDEACEGEEAVATETTITPLADCNQNLTARIDSDVALFNCCAAQGHRVAGCIEYPAEWGGETVVHPAVGDEGCSVFQRAGDVYESAWQECCVDLELAVFGCHGWGVRPADTLPNAVPSSD